MLKQVNILTFSGCRITSIMLISCHLINETSNNNRIKIILTRVGQEDKAGQRNAKAQRK